LELKLTTKTKMKVQEECFMVSNNYSRHEDKLLAGIVAVLFLLALVGVDPVHAKGPANNGNNKQKVQKIMTNDLYAPMDINNIFNYYSNDGDGSFNPYKTDNEGFEFPIGSNSGTCIFEDGLVWTAFKAGTLYCGGSTYNHGLQAGKILQDGTSSSLPVADDPGKAEYRIYRVRPDMKPTTDPTTQAAELATLQNDEVPYVDRWQTLSANDLLTQYWNDWNQWPASEGAPYTDANGVVHMNGGNTYDPTTCIPGFPGADQTQWMVMNDVNSSRTIALYSSNPIGLEVQRTIWAYNRPGALGNTIFISYKFINRSGVRLDSMYVAQWADPDLGYAGDDATGCDTTRSLGYVYNGEATDANFASLGLPPPSAGFDFFQGPIVPGAPTDTAIFDMNYRPGMKNLPMTAFTFFINGNATFGDPELHSNGPNGTAQWYNLMRGLVSTTGQPFPASVTDGTNFCYPGDPVTGTGPTFIGQGSVSPPADVRMCLVSGPFTMAPGDTQEVVVAALVGLGADNLSSITVLRANDDIAQSAYNSLFQLAVPPPQPIVHATQLDNEIVLSWGDPTSKNPPSKIENFTSKGYSFEGYNVYQYPSNSPTNGKLIATYDLKDGVKTIQDTTFSVALGTYIVTPTEYGTDSGIKHSITITKDAFTGNPLVNDRDYYFAVTAYSYNPTTGVVPHALESRPSIISLYSGNDGNGVRPQSLMNGMRVYANLGDTISVSQSGTSDGSVVATVIDPTALTGDQYQITFTNDSVSGNTYWNLKDVTKNKMLATNQVQSSQSTPPPGGNPGALTVDGMAIEVWGPPPGMKDYDIPAGKRDWTWANADAFGLEGFNGAIGMAYNQWYSSSSIDPSHLHKVLIKFATIDSTYYNPVIPFTSTDPNVSMAYRFLRRASSPPADSSFAPFIVKPSGGYAYQDRRPVPFAAYDEDNNMQRLDVGFLENNVSGGRVDGKYDPPSSNDGIDNTSTSGPREWFFIFGTNYNASVDNPSIATDILDNTTPMMWWGTPNMRGTNLFAAGDEFEIIPNYVNSPSVSFSFKTAAPTDSLKNQTADIAKINVFPNPYFGFNKLEIDKYNRWVRFTHLPQKATIRIFNLAGILVRTIVKDDNTQFADWDLLNEHQLPVAAGMYIAYVDCPGLGTKTLKLAIIPEQQFLDHY
jgi:hypothetical protein